MAIKVKYLKATGEIILSGSMPNLVGDVKHEVIDSWDSSISPATHIFDFDAGAIREKIAKELKGADDEKDAKKAEKKSKVKASLKLNDAQFQELIEFIKSIF